VFFIFPKGFASNYQLFVGKFSTIANSLDFLYEILFEQDNIYELVSCHFSFGNAATELSSGGMELYNS